MCRYCYLAVYFTGVLYRTKHGSHTSVCFSSADHLHHIY